MLPLALLISLMLLTWAAAIVATYTEVGRPSSGSPDTEAEDQDYYEAA